MTFTGNPRASSAAHRAWRQAILTRDPICRCRACKHHTGPCHQPSTEADHVIPHASGGSTTLDNGQGLCAPCHAQKTAAHANRTRWARASTHRPTEPHPGLR